MMVCLHKSVGPERQWMILFLQDTFTEWAITAACLERKPMNLSCPVFKLKIINEQAGGSITWQSKCDYLFVLFASPSIFSSFYNPFSSLHSLPVKQSLNFCITMRDFKWIYLQHIWNLTAETKELYHEPTIWAAASWDTQQNKEN